MSRFARHAKEADGTQRPPHYDHTRLPPVLSSVARHLSHTPPPCPFERREKSISRHRPCPFERRETSISRPRPPCHFERREKSYPSPPVLSSVARNPSHDTAIPRSKMSRFARHAKEADGTRRSPHYDHTRLPLSFRASRASFPVPVSEKTPVTLRSDISSPNRERALNGARS